MLKKMKKYTALLFILLTVFVLFFPACQKTIHIDLNDYEKKIVVFSENAEGRQPEIFITESQSYYGYLEIQNTFQFLKDATVILRSGGISQTLTPATRFDTIPDWWMGLGRDSIEVHYYTSNTPLVSGQKYELEVVHNNRTVTSEMVIPSPVQVKSVEEEVINDPFGGTVYQLSAVFDDSKGQKDYYKIGTITTYSYSEWNPNTGQFDTISLSYTNYSIVPEVQDGEEIKSVVYSNYGGNNEGTKVKFFINRLSYGLGNYLESVNAQSNNGSDPFTEPTLLRSNIQNGMGAFGGYSVSDTVYREW